MKLLHIESDHMNATLSDMSLSHDCTPWKQNPKCVIPLAFNREHNIRIQKKMIMIGVWYIKFEVAALLSLERLQRLTANMSVSVYIISGGILSTVSVWTLK